MAMCYLFCQRVDTNGTREMLQFHSASNREERNPHMATALRSSGLTTIVNGDLRHNVLLRIPADAHTHAGFRSWVRSDACPEKLPVMFLNGEIYIDMSMEEIRS